MKKLLAKKDFNRKFIILYSTAVGSLAIWLLAGCSGAADERAQKDQQSNDNGGLNRIARVYDNNGHLLSTYEGKFDVDSSDGVAGRVKFDLNGKRHIIYNAVVIIDEK